MTMEENGIVLSMFIGKNVHKLRGDEMSKAFSEMVEVMKSYPDIPPLIRSNIKLGNMETYRKNTYRLE